MRVEGVLRASRANLLGLLLLPWLGFADVSQAQAPPAAGPPEADPAPEPTLKMLLAYWPDLDWSKPAPPGARAPSKDPRDLSGIWRQAKAHLYLQPDEGAAPNGWAPYTPEAKGVFMHRLRMNFEGTPVAEALVYCRPIGVVRGLTFPIPFEIIQQPGQIWQLFGEGGTRVIYMDQQHPKELKPSYMGHSVGRWEGGTLVVDSAGFNDKTWLDMAGSPHGEKLHVVERYAKSSDGSYIDVEIIIEDPDFYTRPFTIKTKNIWHPELEIPNYHCEDNPRAVVVKGVTTYR